MRDKQRVAQGDALGAGFWIRALARVIDTILHYAVNLMAFLLVGFVAGFAAALTGASPELLGQKLQGVSLMGHVLAGPGYVVYHTRCEGLHGASLGKLICGLVVVKEDGWHCNLGPALGRSLAFFVGVVIKPFDAADSLQPAAASRSRNSDLSQPPGKYDALNLELS